MRVLAWFEWEEFLEGLLRKNGKVLVGDGIRYDYALQDAAYSQYDIAGRFAIYNV